MTDDVEREADIYRLPRKSVRELIDEMRERLTGKSKNAEKGERDG